MNVTNPLVLFRRILQAHRQILPIDARLVGDSFVKEEFTAHKQASPSDVDRFLYEWNNYLDMLNSAPAPTDRGHSGEFLSDIGMAAVTNTYHPMDLDADASDPPPHPFHAEQMRDPLLPEMHILDKADIALQEGAVLPSQIAEYAAYNRLNHIGKQLDTSNLNEEQLDKLQELRQKLFQLQLDEDFVPEDLSEFAQKIQDNPEILDELIAEHTENKRASPLFGPSDNSIGKIDNQDFKISSGAFDEGQSVDPYSGLFTVVEEEEESSLPGKSSYQPLTSNNKSDQDQEKRSFFGFSSSLFSGISSSPSKKTSSKEEIDMSLFSFDSSDQLESSQPSDSLKIQETKKKNK